jgi:hypothetical protein
MFHRSVYWLQDVGFPRKMSEKGGRFNLGVSSFLQQFATNGGTVPKTAPKYT